MQKKKKKLKTPEEFSSDVNMSETCINYSQLKKKYSEETLRVNCNEYCLCSSLLMLREGQQYQMQAPVMLQPQYREVVLLQRDEQLPIYLSITHISSVDPYQLGSHLKTGGHSCLFWLQSIFLVCAFFLMGSL